MRKNGSVFSMMRERNLDLLRAYREALNRNMRSDKDLVYMDLLTETVASQASRYWVSVERASSVIYQMNKGAIPKGMKDNAKVFYKSLFEKFVSYRSDHPKMPIKHIVSIIIESPAPCFVLTPESAKAIISKMRKECYEQTMRRLRHCF